MAAGLAHADVDLRRLHDWTIVVGDGAIASEQYAAQEFQTWLRETAGINLPTAATPPGPEHNVFIGPSPSMYASTVGFSVEKLGQEGLRIRIQSSNIAIAGGRPRGTLYGVYEFFERFMRLRFLTAKATYIPDVNELNPIPETDYTFIPPFEMRFSDYPENRRDPAFGVRLRDNTVTEDERLGGRTPRMVNNHSLCSLVPAAQYGNTHPEYFALVNGQRPLVTGGAGSQVCVSNPDVVRIVTDRILNTLKKGYNSSNISVSQNDNSEYCHCPACNGINRREGSPMGAHLAFVNAVAEGIAPDYPSVKIGTLSYQYTRKPPKTLCPRQNVQIQLCSIECCQLHDLDDPKCPLNREFYKDLKAWGKKTDDIQIWGYIANFDNYDLPLPNLQSLGRNLRVFRDNHIKAVYLEGEYQALGGEMSDLRNYVACRCLWDPARDSWEVAQEFCELYYRDAAGPIIDYLAWLHANAKARKRHPTCFARPKEVGLDSQNTGNAVWFFDQALKLAHHDEIKQRVEQASIGAYAAMMSVRHEPWKFENGGIRRDWPEKYDEALLRYKQLCETYAPEKLSEVVTRKQQFNMMMKFLGMPAVRLENEVWRLTLLPQENGKLVEMYHKPAKRHLLKAVSQPDLVQGALEELGLAGYDNLPATFTAQVEGQTATLIKTLTDGSTVQRKIWLDSRIPEKVCFESALIHHGTEAKKYQIKVRPEFSLDTHTKDWNVISAYIKDGQWKKFNRNWKIDTGPEKELLYQAKDGAVAFYNHKTRYGVLETYDAKQIAYPRLWWNSAWPQLNLELLTPELELQPGQGMTCRYQLQYLEKPVE